jgi:hypothetical protein
LFKNPRNPQYLPKNNCTKAKQVSQREIKEKINIGELEKSEVVSFGKLKM